MRVAIRPLITMNIVRRTKTYILLRIEVYKLKVFCFIWSVPQNRSLQFWSSVREIEFSSESYPFPNKGEKKNFIKLDQKKTFLLSKLNYSVHQYLISLERRDRTKEVKYSAKDQFANRWRLTSMWTVWGSVS